MSMSDYLEKALLDHKNNVTPYTAPSTIYLALFKSDPGEAGSGTEVSVTVDDTAYARKAITFAAATSGVGTAVSSNAQDFDAVVYGSGAAQYTVTHFATFDALTGGHLLEYNAFGAPIVRSVGKTLTLPAGSLTTALE